MAPRRTELAELAMSATFGDDEFYNNLLQYMNQTTQGSFLNTMPLSFSPHEAEKHGLDETMTDVTDSKRRGAYCLSPLKRIRGF